jgi:hypothetical protein
MSRREALASSNHRAIINGVGIMHLSLLARNVLERQPPLFVLAAHLKRLGTPLRQNVLGADTQVMIEAFPRSASSFAVAALKRAQGADDIRIATHLHSYAHVVQGVKKGIPVLVIIRRPRDAVVGVRVWAWQLFEQLGRADRKAAYETPVAELLRRYIRFYEELIPYASGYIAATFEEVTTDFGTVIDRLNHRFGCNYSRFDHKDEEVEQVFRAGKVHLAPSDERKAMKPAFEKEIDDEGVKVLLPSVHLRQRARRASRRSVPWNPRGVAALTGVLTSRSTRRQSGMLSRVRSRPASRLPGPALARA